MPLGLNTEGSVGAYMPIIKYDARAGRFFRVDRVQDSDGNWVTNPVEITHDFQAIIDLDNIEVGWVLFVPGVAPSWSVVPLGQPLPAKPSDEYKQCFRVKLLLGKTSGGDVREFASQAKVVIAGMDELHTAFTHERGPHFGKLPVVALEKTLPITTTGNGQTSTNYRPVFKIVKWVDRPDGLGGGEPSPPASPPPPAPPRTPVLADDEF